MTVAGAVWGGAARSALSGLGFCLFCFGFFPLCGGVGGGFRYSFIFLSFGWLWMVMFYGLLIYSFFLFICVFRFFVRGLTYFRGVPPRFRFPKELYILMNSLFLLLEYFFFVSFHFLFSFILLCLKALPLPLSHSSFSPLITR